MDMKAWTAPQGSYPPYINVAIDRDGRKATIIVRGNPQVVAGPPTPEGPTTYIRCGDTASITIPLEEWERIREL